MATDPKVVAQQITGFLGDPSEVIDAAEREPDWQSAPLAALDRVLERKGYCPEARAEIVEGARHMDKMGAELLSALGIG